MGDLLGWITRLFDDCLARAPFGVGWELDSAQAPLVASVMPADLPPGQVLLDGEGIAERIGFAHGLQALLEAAFGAPMPSCPADGSGLRPVARGDEMSWACPLCAFRSRLGEYELTAFWPPRHADERAAPMLSRRFDRFGVSGVSHFSVGERDGHVLARVALRPDADQAAVLAAASPLAVEVSNAPAIDSIREWHPADRREPAREVLTVTGVAIRGARLDGVLRRADPGDDCDFLVGQSRVRLAAAHRIGVPGSPLLLDWRGVPFAEEGELVSCGGGGEPPGPVRGGIWIFNAGRITVRRERLGRQEQRSVALAVPPFGCKSNSPGPLGRLP